MKIEVLYVADCPSHATAVSMVRGALAAEGIVAPVPEVLVTDGEMAARLKFCGSPTIRINGKVVAPESEKDATFGLSCRLYPDARRIGVPEMEMIQHALRTALREGET